MKKFSQEIVCLKGSEQICQFVQEDPRQILHLIENEGLPAWKRNGERTWRALNVDLWNWMAFQRNKYLKNTPRFIKDDQKSEV